MIPMVCLRRSGVLAALIPAAAMTLAGCTSMEIPNPFASVGGPPPPSAAPIIPPSLRAEDIVGRWGLASYHREQDRARTEVAAKSQCTQPYNIDASPSGGVMMLGHDNPRVQEMNLKGSVQGKTYVGPGAEPAGMDDREIASFDGRVMILKW